MGWTSDFLISGFCDEICADKRLDTQLAVCAALGMEYVTLRFLDLGEGVQNISTLTDSQAATVASRLQEFGLQVSSIGSPVGKTKLLDREDGTKNVFRPAADYLQREVRRCCELAQRLDCKLVRGFSFYHPAGEDPAGHVTAAADRLGPIVELCDSFGLTFGLEVEANLVGQNGELISRLHGQISHPALVLIWDGANLVTQGYSTGEVMQQWEQMKHAVGWIHVKDYRMDPAVRGSSPARPGVQVDEDSLNRFVPVGEGDSGYDVILRDAAIQMDAWRQRLESRGIPGIFLDLEPHVAGGGQFGGYSGADGFGRSFRALVQMLVASGSGCRLRG